MMNIQTHHFTAADGAKIRYKSWMPEGGATRALVLLHRGHEHADRWDTVVPGLEMEGTAIFAWDARGHGESEGKRGHASCFMQYVRDLAEFFAHIGATHGIAEERVVLVAHSVGAVIAATWVHDYAPQLAGLVLATPAFDVNLIVTDNAGTWTGPGDTGSLLDGVVIVKNSPANLAALAGKVIAPGFVVGV